MQDNPEIDAIIEGAVQIAQTWKHEYVLTEHLLLSLVRHDPFRKTLSKYGCDVAMLETELCGYLDSLQSLVKHETDVTPRKTTALERVFNRALTQVLFTGRRQVVTIDLYLAIMGEGNSNAQYFLLKYGVNKSEFVEFWTKNYKSEKSAAGMNHQQATEVLEEYCTSLSSLAATDRLEPLIGRATELDEMIAVLARRFKANVLMVGDPGVGKTAIIEGLAQEIAADRVPEFLKGYEVWSLEIGSLVMVNITNQVWSLCGW